MSRDLAEQLRLPPTIPQIVAGAAPERLALLHRSTTTRQPQIVFAGPLVWPEKVRGVLLLLEAFASVAGRFPDWKLVILGDGPGRKEIEEKARELGLADRVGMPGFDEGVVDSIASAAIYAQISFREGLPLALLNAMAVGTVVIATHVGGIPEVVLDQETGYLVGPTKEAVASGLADLMDKESLRRKLGDAAMKWVRNELSWDQVVTKHLELAMEGRH